MVIMFESNERPKVSEMFPIMLTEVGRRERPPWPSFFSAARDPPFTLGQAYERCTGGSGSSSAAWPPAAGAACTVHSTTRTAMAGPSFFRGGFSSARQVPSCGTFTGFSLKEADARPQEVRPGGRDGAGQRPGQELAVREHDHPGAEAFQQVKR
jgi:hypothetical protein